MRLATHLLRWGCGPSAGPGVAVDAPHAHAGVVAAGHHLVEAPRVPGHGGHLAPVTVQHRRRRCRLIHLQT